MGKHGAAILALCAGVALIGCGGSDSERSSDSLGRSQWTLTITSPQHGSTHEGRAIVRVAVTGEAAARGAERDFDIGYFVDDELRKRSKDTQTEIVLPQGSYALRVEGIDTSGQVLERVTGDEVMVDIGRVLQREPLDIPPVQRLDQRGPAEVIDPEAPSVDVDVEIGDPLPRAP
jgi:hypothetical protein